MSKDEKIVFCTGGGCTAKLGAGVLSRILEKLPRGEKDPNLLVGYDSRDDAAVYRVTEDLALVQTVDFFPPMVDDPYTFGQIAAANALSDVYAMGGEVKTALNLVCFPENMDLNVLGEILRGGAEKVAEAGGILAGGHSIADTGVKYGLSVTGLVDPHHLYANDAGQPGDKLLLTKALGVGLLCTANRVGEAAPEHMAAAIHSMTTLNKTAAEISRLKSVGLKLMRTPNSGSWRPSALMLAGSTGWAESGPLGWSQMSALCSAPKALSRAMSPSVGSSSVRKTRAVRPLPPTATSICGMRWRIESLETSSRIGMIMSETFFVRMWQPVISAT